MSPAVRERAGTAAPVRTSDAEIVARIAAAVHRPFAAAWRDHEETGWRQIRRALNGAAAAHERALEEFAAAAEAVSRADGRAGADGVEDVLAEYRRRVARRVLKPLHVVLARTSLAVPLHRSLAAAAAKAREAVRGLPELAVAPVAPDALAVRAGLGLGVAAVAKRLCARALRPVAWRREVHEVAVSRVALRHLERDVLPRQRLAFRRGQRGRAGWLGRAERAWSEWTRAVLLPPPGRRPGESPERTGAAGALLAAARRLQGELEGLRDEVAAASGGAAGVDFARPSGTLAAEVAVAGTFVAPSPRGDPPARDDEDLAGRWDAWANESAARLELHRSLLAVRTAADAIRRRLTDRWDETGQAVERVLDGVKAALDEGLERAGSYPEDPGRLGPALSAGRERTLRALGRRAARLDDFESFARAMADSAEEAVEDLEAIFLRLPEVAVHDLPEADETVRRPGTGARPVPMREFAAQAFDALRMERIRTAPSVAAEAFERARSEVSELRQVAAYGFEAAIAELAEGADEAPAHALVLVTDGLSRAAAKTAVARTALREGAAAAKARAGCEVADGTERLVRRATADRLLGGYLDARTYLAAEVARDWKRLRGRAARRGARISARIRTLGARLRSVLNALGARPAARKTSGPGENTLASAAEFVRTLPVVYRRLFAFEPVTDPRFLAGRDDELDEVAACWTRWKAGGPGSLVVVASPGAGVTSFLNIVPARIAEEAPRAVRRTLRERIREEADLAARVAAWLGLGEAGCLDELAGKVSESASGSIPSLVVLESAEHLHLRAPGGGRLFRRFVTFVSETESRVFWIVSLTSSAWQLLRAREPTFASDLRRLPLEPLGPGGLRQAIASRHLRSGLPLRYAEPRAGAAALRTRAHRIRKRDRREESIEKDYFERLHRASQGSVRLALFHWLRTADFTTAEGSLLVRPLEPLRPPTDPLDLTLCFALKAFLDHGTLTEDEYREVLRASATECAHTLRSLEKHHFIAPSGHRQGGAGSPGRSAPAVRYRIRPLMTGAVVAHLRSRNILH